MGNSISSQRTFTDNLYKFLFWLTGTFLFDGGKVFSMIQWLYIRNFDSKIRQKVTYDVGDVVDYENPRIVGRHRRPAHTFLRSFKSTEECIRFWSDSNRTDSLLDNIHYLTGEAGKPVNDQSWKFLLVGTPKESPAGWEQPSFNTESKAVTAGNCCKNWDFIALPGHWQLQGHDAPLYTNTVYPFAFDPPRCRCVSIVKHHSLISHISDIKVSDLEISMCCLQNQASFES